MNAFTSRIASLIPVLLIVTSLTTMVAAVASNDLLFAAAIDHASLLEAGKRAP